MPSLPIGTNFDFLDEQDRYFKIHFRIACFLTADGSYTCVATNLSKDEFCLEEIKDLYKLRWGEETSFRELKYTVGLVNFHSRKNEFIIQEVYARMILYNFCEMATNHVIVRTRENTKHAYKINFATAANVCRTYLKSGGDENEMMLLIQRHLTPIRSAKSIHSNSDHRETGISCIGQRNLIIIIIFYEADMQSVFLLWNNLIKSDKAWYNCRAGKHLPIPLSVFALTK